MEALIDGDIIVYSVGFASDQRVYLVKGRAFKYKVDATAYCEDKGIELSEIEKVVTPEPIEYTLHSVKQLLNRVLKETAADKFQIYLTGEGNFREEAATILPYKGNRDPSHKPTHYKEIKEYLIDVWDAKVIEGMEADDAMGIRQMERGGDTVICSIDKDMDMIPGLHYNWRNNSKYTVDEKSALRTFYKQLLTGDAVDNIRGVPGIGKVRAERMLEGLTTEAEMYEAVFAAYRRANDTDEEATDELNENARLLWIWRKERDEWKAPTELLPASLTEPNEITFAVD